MSLDSETFRRFVKAVEERRITDDHMKVFLENDPEMVMSFIRSGKEQKRLADREAQKDSTEHPYVHIHGRSGKIGGD